MQTKFTGLVTQHPRGGYASLCLRKERRLNMNCEAIAASTVAQPDVHQYRKNDPIGDYFAT